MKYKRLQAIIDLDIYIEGQKPSEKKLRTIQNELEDSIEEVVYSCLEKNGVVVSMDNINLVSFGEIEVEEEEDEE
jgi:hypothetical protein